VTGSDMGRKKTEGEFRQVGWRMPREHFDVLAAVARERGIDLSAVLNGIVSDAVPGLRDWLTEREMSASSDECRLKVLGGVVPEKHRETGCEIFLQVKDVVGRKAQDELAERLVRESAPEGEPQALLRTWVRMARVASRVVEEIAQKHRGG